MAGVVAARAIVAVAAVAVARVVRSGWFVATAPVIPAGRFLPIVLVPGPLTPRGMVPPAGAVALG